jgi:hypothetical protein
MESGRSRTHLLFENPLMARAAESLFGEKENVPAFQCLAPVLLLKVYFVSILRGQTGQGSQALERQCLNLNPGSAFYLCILEHII